MQMFRVLFLFVSPYFESFFFNYDFSKVFSSYTVSFLVPLPISLSLFLFNTFYMFSFYRIPPEGLIILSKIWKICRLLFHRKSIELRLFTDISTSFLLKYLCWFSRNTPLSTVAFYSLKILLKAFFTIFRKACLLT